MAEENPNRLSEWLLIVREQAPVLRRRFLDWVEDCKQQPYLIWETTAVRYSAYGLIVLVVMWVCSTATTMLSPPLPVDAQSLATSGDFHVLCSDEDCGQHFVINRAFGFHDFPVRCPACKLLSGQSARRCLSTVCGGRYVVPIERDGQSQCPYCQETFP